MPRGFEHDDRTLVIVDWSKWLHVAFARDGVETYAARVCGWLAQLLSEPQPPSIVVAVDPDATAPEGIRSFTFRHRLTAHLPPDKRYKAGRSVRPPEFADINSRLLDLVHAHRIPVLFPEDPTSIQDWEADDAAAAATKRAVSEGRSVVLLSADKDWLQLVADDPTAPKVARWDGKETLESEEVVIERYGVTPGQMCDWLSIRGDTSDRVPGVPGLGPKGATKILVEHGTLDAALDTPPADRWTRRLHEYRAEALFSRQLIQLHPEVPILWEPDEQPTGGFDVKAIRRMYHSFGFTRLEEETPTFQKARW